MKRTLVIIATLAVTTEVGITASMHYADPARVGYICHRSPHAMRHFFGDNNLGAKYTERMQEHYGEKCWYPSDGTSEQLARREIPKKVFPPLLPTPRPAFAQAKTPAKAVTPVISLAPRGMGDLKAVPVETKDPGHIQKLKILLAIDPALFPNWSRNYAIWADRNNGEDFNTRVRELTLTRITKKLE